ncbi:translation initiation factor IF-2-like [Aquila chrysaetos chrysaetos]|uniref:translation initiation factor IF-2-like n=1 Tax=Aquila chrysaetos chrysaetos TaxID=223781 RepID=UPI0011771D0D|nr:translation initiation factor IF-2-like [Aquila chrysaetos chrysaetos]XP_029880470.1 translation initiation factor IF-2-like [Aquila chrysaetos chrysaetos]
MRSRAQHKEAEALIPITSSKQSSCLCLASTARQLQRRAPRPGRAGPCRPGGRSGVGHCLRPFPRAVHRGTWERSRDGCVKSPLRFVRDQLGADSSRDGRVGGPAFHFRWSPRSLSGPQGPRERDGGRGLGAGSGRGGAAAAAAAAAGLSEPVPGRRGAAAARLPAAAGLGSPRRPGAVRGRARSPARGPYPLPPRCPAEPAAALGLTHPPPQHHSGGRRPARGQSQDTTTTTPPPSPGSPSVPAARRPGCRPRGGCWASAGTTGRAAPLSLLHYCHGRSEQCNNERASVRRGAARAGDEPVTACGDGTSRRPPPPRATLTGGGEGGFGCATFFV